MPTEQPSSPSHLRKFTISGLHGDRNLTLHMDNGIRILIDDNGTGKTTLLSMLYYLLSGRTHRLSRFAFSQVSIEFSSGETIVFTREELVAGAQEMERFRRLRHHDRLPNQFPDSYWRILVGEAQSKPYSALREHPLFRRILESSDIPPRYLWEMLREAVTPERQTDPDGKLRRLTTLLPDPVLYFPTYRRVEEDLNSLGYPEREMFKDEDVIQFGMQDVKQRLDGVMQEIRASSVEWYSIVNGKMISQLVDGIQVTPDMLGIVNAPEALRIVLDRIGENIATEKKQDILRIVSEGRLGESKYEPLVYFLSNLMQIYEKQRDRDDDIKAFARVVNGYLSDKEVRYNESKLSITVVQKRTSQEVRLDSLSSGEKQIVSIFSKLYLSASSSKTYTVLFDEPELSLSMEWQKRLLLDIVQSGRCPLLIAATHSPFIFENALDQHAAQLHVSFVDMEDAHE